MKSNKSEIIDLNRDFTQEPSDDYQTLKQQFEDLQKTSRTLEMALERAESTVASQSEFLASMSHDLRTPLHAILSYSRFGVDKIDRVDKEKIVKYFRSIEESGKKLQEMLNQIVDLAKLESGKMAFQMYTINLNLIVAALLKDHRQNLDKKNLSIKTSFPEETNLVSCDQNKIGQVMNSLLNNAIHYSPEAETIHITIENSPPSQATPEQAVKISFQDQREERIPQEIVENFSIFIDQERKKTGGRVNGINLAIAYEIIKHHHGSMQAQNCNPRGVSYLFTLPLNQPE